MAQASPSGPVSQWIRHWPTEPGIAGSSPAGVISPPAALGCSPRLGRVACPQSGTVDKTAAPRSGDCRFESRRRQLSVCNCGLSVQALNRHRPTQNTRLLAFRIFRLSGYTLDIDFLKLHRWPRGPMDKASAYRAGDCRFESYRGHALSLIAVASFPLLHKFKSQL